MSTGQGSWEKGAEVGRARLSGCERRRAWSAGRESCGAPARGAARRGNRQCSREPDGGDPRLIAAAVDLPTSPSPHGARPWGSLSGRGPQRRPRCTGRTAAVRGGVGCLAAVRHAPCVELVQQEPTGEVRATLGGAEPLEKHSREGLRVAGRGNGRCSHPPAMAALSTSNQVRRACAVPAYAPTSGRCAAQAVTPGRSRPETAPWRTSDRVEGTPSVLQRFCRRLRGGWFDGVDKASAAASMSTSTWILRNCSRVSSSWSVKPPSLRRIASARN